MKFLEIDRLADHAVLPGLDAHFTHECSDAGETLAWIAVADARKLYLTAGYPSMKRYCVGKMNMSWDVAAKRIQTARAARRFPALFAAVEDNRLHLSAAAMLAPHLNKENAAELIAGATRKTKAQIAELLAAHFPRPDVPTLVMEIGPAGAGGERAPGHVEPCDAQRAPGHVDVAPRRAKVTPLALHRFSHEFTAGQELHDLFERAQDLLGHAVCSGDLDELFVRALRVFVAQLEKRRFAATDNPRARRASKNLRHIPADIRRAVRARDGGQCTFMSGAGHRCGCRRGLQFDHVTPLARGGETTVANIRLRCPAHNQHMADRTLGKGFMDEKRRDAQRRTAEAKAQKAEADASRAQARAAAAQARAAEDELLATAADVIPALKHLGFRGDELRVAAGRVAAIPDAPQEQRIRHALKGLGRASMHQSPHFAGGTA